MASDQPLISIITINYNDGDKLEDTIKSVINQDYELVEYIIVDGSSTDQSLNIMNQYASKIAIAISEPDNGLYDAMNKGIKRASGEWILFMNSGDCFYSLSVLSDIFLVSREQQNVIYGDCEVRYDGFSVIKLAKHDQKQLWKGMMFSHQSMLTRKKILDKNQFQYDLFPSASDFELIYQLSRNEVFYYSDSIISSVDAGGVSDTNRLQSISERYKIITHSSKKTFYMSAYYGYLLLDSVLRYVVKKLVPKILISFVIKKKKHK